MWAASSARDDPARERALTNSAAISNAGASASYSALTLGLAGRPTLGFSNGIIMEMVGYALTPRRLQCLRLRLQPALRADHATQQRGCKAGAPGVGSLRPEAYSVFHRMISTGCHEQHHQPGTPQRYREADDEPPCCAAELVGRIGAHRVRAKRGPMTGSGVIRRFMATRRRVTASAFALRATADRSPPTRPTGYGLILRADIKMMLRWNCRRNRNHSQDTTD
jgi:hypothetical protein